MKKVMLQKLDAYRLSAGEKRRVVGGFGLIDQPTIITSVLCDCGQGGAMWMGGCRCPSGCIAQSPESRHPDCRIDDSILID